MKYIDADLIRKEVKRRTGYISVTHFAEELLSVIDSLQQEQPSEDLESEIEKYFQGLWPGMKTAEQCNTDLHFTPPAIMRLARHFYELGKKSKEPVTEDLEVRKQIEELANDWHHKGFASDEDCPLCMQDLMDILWHFYELGLKAKKED